MKIKLLIILILALLAFGCDNMTSDSSSVASDYIQWVKTSTGNTSDLFYYDIATDSLGNVYCSGYVLNPSTYDYGNGVSFTKTDGGTSPVLVKYDSQGDALWVKTASITGGSNFIFSYTHIAIDSDDNIVVAGYIYGSGSVTLSDSVTLSSTTSYAYVPVMMKYDSQGDLLWVNEVTATSQITFNDLALDSNDDIYAIGYQRAGTTVDFGNGISLSGSGWSNSYSLALVKYSSDGVTQWVESIGGDVNSKGEGLHIDSQDNLYVVGAILSYGNAIFTGDIIIFNTDGDGDGSFSQIKDNAAFLALYDTDGEPQWVSTIDQLEDTYKAETYYKDVTADSLGNIYALGYVESSADVSHVLDFGNGVTQTTSDTFNYNLFAQYDDTGTAQSAKLGTEGSDEGSYYTDIAIDESDNIVLAGYQLGTDSYDYGNGVHLTGSSDDRNLMILNIDSTGLPSWGRTISGSTMSTVPKEIISNSVGSFYYVGYQRGTDTVTYASGVDVTGNSSGYNGVLSLCELF